MSAPISTLAATRCDAALSAYGALRQLRWSGLILGALIFSGCSTAPRVPYTAADEAAAVIPNMADVRVFADVPAVRFRSALCPNLNFAVGRAAVPTYLALSGGGADGAYGAGVLNGWTASGTRPEFTVVSGVSTGAMIASFAFLGPSYDNTLRQLYTSGVAENLLASPRPLNVLFGSGVFGNQRLRELVARYVDQPMLARIAAEYVKGRCLAVVTTDLDAQRPVVWDMGRIASYGSPAALELFRDVLTASASTPIVFAPVFIDVEANDRIVQEMHVDGGVTAPVFTLPEAFLLSNARPEPGLRLNIYVLINDEIDPDFRVVPDRTVNIAGQTVSTMIKDRIRSVIFRTYEFAQENGLGFNLTYIAPESATGGGVGFDTVYMRRIYEYGYEKARSGRFWQTSAPSPGPPALSRSSGRGRPTAIRSTSNMSTPCSTLVARMVNAALASFD
jgi:predicted acylesterase/phospholipase RssA